MIDKTYFFTLSDELESYYSERAAKEGKTISDLVIEDANRWMWYCRGCVNEGEK
jgi:hypothetical protein